MAIARLSVKVGHKGSAGKHARYVARQGQYASRLEKGEKLEATEYGNMPSWAAHDPSIFWDCADALERKNGTAYREFEIALPRELNPEQRVALVRDFCQQEIGNKHAYQWAIHTPTAVDGGEQPHCHLMFSERLNDGIHRDPTHYFKQYNANNPSVGGAQKAALGVAGYQSPQQRKDALLDLRDRWGKACNKHLEMAQKPQRIDMRSYQKQGVDREPERKMLPSEWRDTKQKNVLIEYRAIRKERDYSGDYSQCWSKETTKQKQIESTDPMKSARLDYHLSQGVQKFMQGYENHQKDEQERLREQQAQREKQAERERLLQQIKQNEMLEAERQRAAALKQKMEQKQKKSSHRMRM